MTEQTKPVLKTYFTTGAKPTQSQFGDLIDTFITEASGGGSGSPIATGTILSNITGSPAIAAANTLTSVLDAIVTAARGSIVFRGASVWQPLSPGTNGQLLKSGGAGADLSWATASGTGTVTSVSAGSGITASSNPITGAGDIGLKDIPGKRLMANITAVSAVPVANTLTAMIDTEVSGSQGGILYRNATSWVALAPGTNGQVLTAAGVSANPAWGGSSQGALVFITAVTAAGAATLDITSAISSTYNDYKIVLNDVQPSANGSNLEMRTSTNNGSSFDSGASNYAWAFTELTNSATAPQGNATATFIQLGDSQSNAATAALCGDVYLYNVNGTTNHKRAVFNLSFEDGVDYNYVSGHGVRVATTAPNAVRFLYNTGNITGVAKIFGIQKS